jgi:hypothetical protein
MREMGALRQAMRGEDGQERRHPVWWDFMSFRCCQTGDGRAEMAGSGMKDKERCHQIAHTGAPVRVKENPDDPEQLDWQELFED